MTPSTSNNDDPRDDAELHQVLKRYDPIAPPSPTSLASLERDILAKIDGRPDGSHDQASFIRLLPAWMLPQEGALRAVILASMLIIASGFICGQLSFGEADPSASLESPSLFALADEPIVQSVPVTDVSWGENNKDAQ